MSVDSPEEVFTVTDAEDEANNNKDTTKLTVGEPDENFLLKEPVLYSHNYFSRNDAEPNCAKCLTCGKVLRTTTGNTKGKFKLILLQQILL